MASSNTGAGSSGEGEEQEDPSSSFPDGIKVAVALSDLDLNKNQQDEDPVDELSTFREQWQRELVSTPSPQRDTSQTLKVELPLSDEDKAKNLFLQGVEYEQSGKLYEAIQHYKRAMQILPDVEARLYESTELRVAPQLGAFIKPSVVEDELDDTSVMSRIEEAGADEDDDDVVEGEDLVMRLQRILTRKGQLCEPEHSIRGCHISWLPYEVILLILRWVVSSELDAASLEKLSCVCRGLYVIAREPEIWREMCLRTWGLDCSSPRQLGFGSWRQMYIERPRLHLHGCYISKTTYLRHGENSFQDQFYRPWYLVEYYRYLRFFPDGLVLVWTTAEEPAASVPQLRARQCKPALGILRGHYRLVGNKVVIIIKKSEEKRPPSAPRYRRRRETQETQHEHTFHMELELCNLRSRRNHQLSWRVYSVSTRRDHWNNFDICAGKFPPFSFSRVRSYTHEAFAPLGAY